MTPTPTPPLSDFGGLFVRDFAHVLGGRVLVALSGGADSVALLHLLLDPQLGLQLEAAHCHHGARGAEADADAEFCLELCFRLRLPFHLLRVEIEPHSREGREASWRRSRYHALLETARGREIRFVATAHQRDDVAEGVLMQLLRGAGPRAMAGIAASTPSGVIRPLLHFGRAAIIEWLSSQGLAWREDRSNQDLRHPRNRVRHQVLPALEELFPRVRDHLVALAKALAEDDAFLAAELERRAAWIDLRLPDRGVPLREVADLPRALQTRWLLAQVERAGLGPATRRQVEQLHAALEHGRPRVVNLASRWRLRVARGTLWLEPPHLVPHPGRWYNHVGSRGLARWRGRPAGKPGGGGDSHMSSLRVVYSAERIHERVAEVASRISEDYRDKELVLLGILKGVAFLLADLARFIPKPVDFEFVDVTSSPGERGEVVSLTYATHFNVHGRHVLILKDVLHSGVTENYLLTHLSQQKPASMEIVALVDKPHLRSVNLNARYAVFNDVPEGYLVGYGLGIGRGLYSNRPDLCILEDVREGEQPGTHQG